MTKDLLTVAEYAEVEKVSRQAVYQRMKSDNWKKEHCQEIGGKIYINTRSFDQTLLYENTKNEKKIQELLIELEGIQREVEILREQINRKDVQIEELVTGWKEAQRNNSVLSHKLLLLEGIAEQTKVDKVSDIAEIMKEPEESLDDIPDQMDQGTPEPEIQERRSVFKRLFKTRRK